MNPGATKPKDQTREWKKAALSELLCFCSFKNIFIDFLLSHSPTLPLYSNSIVSTEEPVFGVILRPLASLLPRLYRLDARQSWQRLRLPFLVFRGSAAELLWPLGHSHLNT